MESTSTTNNSTERIISTDGANNSTGRLKVPFFLFLFSSFNIESQKNIIQDLPMQRGEF